MRNQPPPVWRPKPIAQDVARVALNDARDAADQYMLSLEFAIGVIHVLADRRMPERISDRPAERRVIGWLLSGRARPSDVAEISVYDFAGEIQRLVYSMALSIVEMGEDGLVDLSTRSARSLLLPAVEAHLHDHLQRIETELLWTPCPAKIPQREIDLVASLGRAWSGIEEQYEERVAILAAERAGV